MPKSRKTGLEKIPKRMLEAEKDFFKLQREIAPFVKVRRVVEPSSAGQWQDASIQMPSYPCGIEEKRKAEN